MNGKETDIPVGGCVLPDYFFTAVCGTVIDEQYFIVIREPDGKEGIQRGGNILLQIVYRYNN